MKTDAQPTHRSDPPVADLPKADDDVLWEREERFWTGGAASGRSMTARDAVFVLPYPAGILQGDAVWREGQVAQRWRSIVLSDRCLSVRGAIAVLAYRISAERAGSPIYDALCTSSYMRDGEDWLRVAHQQTPTA